MPFFRIVYFVGEPSLARGERDDQLNLQWPSMKLMGKSESTALYCPLALDIESSDCLSITYEVLEVDPRGMKSHPTALDRVKPC